MGANGAPGPPQEVPGARAHFFGSLGGVPGGVAHLTDGPGGSLFGPDPLTNNFKLLDICMFLHNWALWEGLGTHHKKSELDVRGPKRSVRGVQGPPWAPTGSPRNP